MGVLYGGLLLLVVASLVAIDQSLSRANHLHRKADIVFVQYKARVDRKIKHAATERAMIEEEIEQYKDQIKSIALQRREPRGK